MRILSPTLWLQQAKADETASRVKHGLAECHRRYFLQQAYEKGIKALAIACMGQSLTKNKQFASALGDCFLHHHTPLTIFSNKDDAEWEEELRSAYGSTGPSLLKRLKTLRTEVARRLQDKADQRIVDAWMAIDATRPTKAVDAVSYRYPFADGATHPDGVAPTNWTGWSAYQGPEAVVRDAISELLQRAGTQVSLWKRAT